MRVRQSFVIMSFFKENIEKNTPFLPQLCMLQMLLDLYFNFTQTFMTFCAMFRIYYSNTFSN